MINNTLKTILKNKEVFTHLEPYTHYVIDGLFDDNILKSISNIDSLKSANGQISTFNNDKEIKIGISHIDKNSGLVYDILQYLNSDEFVSFLAELTDIPDLFVDPNFNGGGIHLIPKGGKLDIHVDFSRAIFDETKFRRVNVLLYLNEGWQEEWEGSLELWDKNPSNGGKCVKKLYPIFNRLAIFKTCKNSWHGHPTPLNCPEGEYRKSLACYYYSSFPSDDLEVHSTVYEENIPIIADKDSVDVICLTDSKNFDLVEQTKQTINSIIYSEKKINFNIILIDSNPNSEYVYENVTHYVKPNIEFNYNKYLNIASDYLKSEWILITNDDVRYEKNWFSEILKVYEHDSTIESFSPKEILIYSTIFGGHFSGELNDDFAYWLNYKVSEGLLGYSILMRRKVWNLIYPWDENFDFYYQDNDYAKLIESFGIKHALVRDSIILHIGNISFFKNENDEIRNKKMQDGYSKYLKKWGG